MGGFQKGSVDFIMAADINQNSSIFRSDLIKCGCRPIFINIYLNR